MLYVCFLATEQVRPFTAPLSPLLPLLPLAWNCALVRRVWGATDHTGPEERDNRQNGFRVRRHKPRQIFVVLVEVELFVRRLFHTTALVELFEPLLGSP